MIHSWKMTFSQLISFLELLQTTFRLFPSEGLELSLKKQGLIKQFLNNFGVWYNLITLASEEIHS